MVGGKEESDGVTWKKKVSNKNAKSQTGFRLSVEFFVVTLWGGSWDRIPPPPTPTPKTAHEELGYTTVYRTTQQYQDDSNVQMY